MQPSQIGALNLSFPCLSGHYDATGHEHRLGESVVRHLGRSPYPLALAEEMDPQRAEHHSTATLAQAGGHRRLDR